MSTYRRYRDGRTERWSPDRGTWDLCAADEPETRVRKPNEGMVILPGELTGDTPTVPIAAVLAAAVRAEAERRASDPAKEPPVALWELEGRAAEQWRFACKILAAVNALSEAATRRADEESSKSPPPPREETWRDRPPLL